MYLDAPTRRRTQKHTDLVCIGRAIVLHTPSNVTAVQVVVGGRHAQAVNPVGKKIIRSDRRFSPNEHTLGNYAICKPNHVGPGK